jgi:hypothetical protein
MNDWARSKVSQGPTGTFASYVSSGRIDSKASRVLHVIPFAFPLYRGSDATAAPPRGQSHLSEARPCAEHMLYLEIFITAFSVEDPSAVKRLLASIFSGLLHSSHHVPWSVSMRMSPSESSYVVLTTSQCRPERKYNRRKTDPYLLRDYRLFTIVSVSRPPFYIPIVLKTLAASAMPVDLDNELRLLTFLQLDPRRCCLFGSAAVSSLTRDLHNHDIRIMIQRPRLCRFMQILA